MRKLFKNERRHNMKGLNKLVLQRIIGGLALLMILFIVFTLKGDTGALLLGIPITLAMVFSKKVWFFDETEKEEA